MKIKITCILISVLFVTLVILSGIGCKKVLSEPIVIPEPSYWPTEGWKETTPESQGFNSDKLADILNTIKNIGLGSGR